jgi:hypothetical protein
MTKKNENIITAADSYNANFVAPETAHNAAMNSAIRQRPMVIAAGIVAMRHADAAKAEATAGNKNDAFKSALKHVDLHRPAVDGYDGIGDWSFMAEREQRTHATALRALGKRFQSDDIERLACKIDELLEQISDGIKSIAGIETAAKKLDKAADADDDASDDDASDDDTSEAEAPKRTKAEFLAWVQKQYATEFNGADFFSDLEMGKMDKEIDFDEPANALTSS